MASFSHQWIARGCRLRFGLNSFEIDAKCARATFHHFLEKA